jgi:hypothetical protein
LQALHALRPYNEAKTTFDVTQEYPRRFLTRYDQRHPDGHAPVVRTWWKLSDKATSALTVEFGADVLNGDVIEVSKYDKKDNPSWTVPINEEAAIKNLVKQANFNASEKSVVASAENLTSLISALTAVSERTPKQADLLKRVGAYRDGSLHNRAVDIVSPFVPKFFYASHYDRMSGQVSVNKLLEDEEHNRVDVGDSIFLDFLELAGTSLEELKESRRYEDLKAKCEAASNDISSLIGVRTRISRSSWTFPKAVPKTRRPLIPEQWFERGCGTPCIERAYRSRNEALGSCGSSPFWCSLRPCEGMQAMR